MVVVIDSSANKKILAAEELQYSTHAPKADSVYLFLYLLMNHFTEHPYHIQRNIFITFNETSCKSSHFTEQYVKLTINYLLINSLITLFNEVLFYMCFHKPSLVQNRYQARYGRTKFHAMIEENMNRKLHEEGQTRVASKSGTTSTPSKS